MEESSDKVDPNSHLMEPKSYPPAQAGSYDQTSDISNKVSSHTVTSEAEHEIF